MTRNGLLDASCDPATVAAWWERWPSANIGVRTGAVSGLVVLDIDPRHGGFYSLRELERRYGRLPRGPRVLTGGGGQHRYFRAPETPVRSTVGQLGPGLDVRGERAYVVAPPSRHVSGNVYRWLPGQHTGLPALPGWLASGPETQPVAVGESRELPDGCLATRYGRAAIEGITHSMLAATAGERNQTLVRAAYRCGRLAAAGELDGDAARDILVEAAQRTGLTASEATRTFKSGFRAGHRSPAVRAAR